MSSEGLHRLNIWVEAKQLAIFTYQHIIPHLPIEEKWGLSIQIKRSVSSIPANIAEGYGRYYYQEDVRFCYNARGSLEETISHVILASELGFIPTEIKSEFVLNADKLCKQINGYIAYLRRSKNSVSEPDSPYSEHDVNNDLNIMLAEEKNGM